jgi:hypothetical protein
MALHTKTDGSAAKYRHQARFQKPLVISGIFIPRGRFDGSRRFSARLDGATVSHPDYGMVFRLSTGPVRSVTVAVLGGRAEAVGISETGETLLLSGVKVGEKSLFELTAEWFKTLAAPPRR